LAGLRRWRQKCADTPHFMITDAMRNVLVGDHQHLIVGIPLNLL
jgi:hypothetical protein